MLKPTAAQPLLSSRSLPLLVVSSDHSPMEYKLDFKVKMERLMKTTTVVVAIILIAGALAFGDYVDQATVLAGIASITGLAALLRL